MGTGRHIYCDQCGLDKSVDVGNGRFDDEKTYLVPSCCFGCKRVFSRNSRDELFCIECRSTNIEELIDDFVAEPSMEELITMIESGHSLRSQSTKALNVCPNCKVVTLHCVGNGVMWD